MKKLGILLSVASGMIAAIGTKAVNAKPMTRQEYNDFRGWQLPENENGADEGYLVEYQDGEPNTTEYNGYVSWSPKAQFDNAHQDVTKGVSFGHAVELLKGGHRVAREGWNGKGMWLTMVYPDDGANVPPRPAYAVYAVAGIVDDATNGCLPWIGMKTADNKFVPWLASHTYVLAEDWVITD